MATEFSKLHRVDGRTGAMLPRIKKVVSAPPVGSHAAVRLHPNQYVCTLGILTLDALTVTSGFLAAVSKRVNVSDRGDDDPSLIKPVPDDAIAKG